MRILRAHISGYGRFQEREVTFEPGLMIIVGPNEKGKSTLRSFIADMLYGQKRSLTQRVFDETNTLRRPWAEGARYAGALAYQLADGRAFEVRRCFDREQEALVLVDANTGNDAGGANRTRANANLHAIGSCCNQSSSTFASRNVSADDVDVLGKRFGL